MTIKKLFFLLTITIFSLLAYGSIINPNNLTMIATVGFLILCFLVFFQISHILFLISTNKISNTKIYIFSAIIGFIPTYLLALTSLSSLKVLDIFFILATSLVVIWYTNRIVK